MSSAITAKDSNTGIARPSMAAFRSTTVQTERDEQINAEEWKQLMAEFCVFVCSFIAIVLNAIAVASCRMLVLEGGQFIQGGFGLFLLQPPDTPTCRGTLSAVTSERFPDFVWDPRSDEVLKFAQAGGLLALILGVILVINITIRQFCKEVRFYKLILYLCATGIQVTLGWVHLIWWSKGCDFFYCSYGGGITFLILSHIFWFVACLFTRYMRPSKVERKNVALSHYTSQLRLQLKERQKRYEMEYLPVGVSLLIMSLLIFLALRNINEDEDA
ncbi:unnamed protein product [Cylindrotheca closterium]|uniref:Uncharacterized protein n=1 Tax=Cylindrotheca closterium TaxID=2856 RepID=A0AAD2GAN6_9STRA|nr:unnamed protein product [Cylindrotheca closterium]